MSAHLSLVPMPEYSEPDTAPDADAQAADELDPFQSWFYLLELLHKVAVVAPVVAKTNDPLYLRDLQPSIDRAIAALQTLQAAALSEVG
jgi:hypothetical protein